MKSIIEQYIDVVIQIIAEITFFVFVGIGVIHYQEVINHLFDKMMFR